MRPHIHAGVVTGIATFAMVIIAGSIWRTVTYRILDNNPESAIGQAMAVAY
jgi:hypothetical protein